MEFTKDTKIGDLLGMAPNRDILAGILMNMGMHCLGCPASRAETLEEACFVHGVDVEAVTKQIKDAFDEYEKLTKEQQ